MKKFSLIFLITALLVIAGSASAYYTASQAPTPETSVVFVPDNDPADAKFPEGAKIYKAKCVACHQLNGEGIAGAFPPLKNSDYLFADKKRAVKQVLNGSNSQITVNGVNYAIPMPFQVDTHEDAVAVINYVLNAWGNDGGTISLSEVQDIKIERP